MNQDELIQQLTKNHAPVKRLASPPKRFLSWFGITIFCMGASFSLMNIRHDIAEMVSSMAFIFETVVILVLGLSSALSAFVISVPGNESKNWPRYIPLLTVILWLFFIISKIFTHDGVGHFNLDWGHLCFTEMVVVGIIPGMALLWMVKRAAPTKPWLEGVFIFMTLCGVGAFGVQFTCSSNGFLHLLCWHFLPLLFIGLLGGLIGKKFLRW